MTKTALILVSLTTFSAASAQAQPPVAPVDKVVDEYFGTEVADPYRPLENLESEEVQKWMRAQADWARQTLDAIPEREEILDRIVELERSSAASVHNVQRVLSDRYFYYRSDPGEDVYKLCTREGLDGEERVLVDPAVWQAETGEPHAINYFRVSPDGRLVAYGISAGGSEEAVIYVVDAMSGEQVSGPIDRADFGLPSWLPGRDAFTYMRLQKLGEEADPAGKYKDAQDYLHVVGRDPEKDPIVFGNAVTEGIEIAEMEIPVVVSNPASEHVVGALVRGVQNEIAIYAKPRALLEKAKTPWTQIVDFNDEVTRFAVEGDNIYLQSHKDAPRYKILKTRISAPDLETAEVVLPPGEAVIQNIVAARDALYVRLLDGGPSKVVRVDYDNYRVEELPLPEAGRVLMGTNLIEGYSYSQDPRQTGVIFQLTSWTKERRIYRYDPDLGQVIDTGLRPAGPNDAPDDLVATEVKIPSHDETMVPLSIVHRRGVVKNGANPTLMLGYGSYEISIEPYFSLSRLTWLEQGGIFAVCHVRGGGEYGVEWHHAGQKLTKANTWKDFIACGEWLVENRYTSSHHLAGWGGSAGGILIGRSITERPDLFATAVLDVGMLDTVRTELEANGPPNIPEFGTHTEEEGFRGLYEMSSYHHVEKGVAYPAVILLHGVNDPRVDVWQSSKMAARLQAATSSDKPVLLRLEYAAGHGIGSTKTQVHEELADVYSYLLWQFGTEGFQPGS